MEPLLAASRDPIVKKQREKNDEPETWGEIWKAWPKSTFCIIGDELCEKFSFFGMRGKLTSESIFLF